MKVLTVLLQRVCAAFRKHAVAMIAFVAVMFAASARATGPSLPDETSITANVTSLTTIVTAVIAVAVSLLLWRVAARLIGRFMK